MALLFVTTTRTARTRSDDAVAFIILPIVFLAVGLGVGIPLLVMGRRTSNARYFVTTSSAIILYAPTAWSGSRVTVLPLKNLQQITLSENRDGTGTLTFGQVRMPLMAVIQTTGQSIQSRPSGISNGRRKSIN